jgi:hypothetical protein
MRWKLVLVAGLLTALALFAAAWLLVVAGTPPRAPIDVARAIVVLASALVLFAIGEGAIYVDRHPTFGMCTRVGNLRAQCYQQPDRPEAEDRAAELFLSGSAVVAAMATAAFVAIRRTRPPRAA